jgi:hypothetical protein
MYNVTCKVMLVTALFALPLSGYALSKHTQGVSKAGHAAPVPLADVPGYSAIENISAQATKSKSLTSAQITVLGSYINSPYNIVKMLDLGILCKADPAHASEAEAVARKALISPDSVVRKNALGVLNYLHAPDTVTIARRMLSDPSGNVTTEAKMILKEYHAAS